MADVKDINREDMRSGKFTGKPGLILTLLLLILLLPFLSVSYLLNSELDTETRFIAQQKAGFSYVNAVHTLLEHVQQHRGIAQAYLSGELEFESQLSELVTRIKKDILAVENARTAFYSMPQAGEEWVAWRKDWFKLQQRHLQMSPADNFDAHTVLIDELLTSVRKVVDVFRLVLDTQLDSRALAEAVMQMPWLMEDIGQLRGLGAGIIAHENISANEKARLRSLAQSISVGMDVLVRNMTTLFQQTPSLQNRLSTVLDQAVSSTSHFLGIVHKQISKSTELKASVKTYFSAGTAALDYYYRLFTAIDNEFNNLLTMRLEEMHQKQILMRMSMLLVLAVTIVIYVMFLRHQVARQRLWQKLQETVAELSDSKQKTQAIVDNAADSIIAIDENGLIDSFSTSAEHMFGYSAAEIIGKNVKKLMPEPESSAHDGYLHRYMKSGDRHIVGTGPREVVALRHNGTTFPAELVVSEMVQEGQNHLFIGLLRDITSRKEAEEELRASEERFALITRGTKDGIWDWDLIADKIYFSPRWKSMLFYEDHEIESNFKALQALIHPDDLGVALDHWTDCMSGKTDSFTIEYRLKNKHGSYTWVRCRGMVQNDDNGDPVRMAGSHTDISQQKQVSAAMDHMHHETLVKAEELEFAHRELQTSHEQLLQSEKLASIGQLAAGVAHEINNPVGYVYSNLGTLQKYIDNLFQMLEGYEQLEQLTSTDEAVMKSLQKLKQELDLEYLKEDVRDLVSESREGISRVKSIVQDLKDFSHVDEAEWQWADLHRGLDSTLNIVNNEIKYKAEVVKEYSELPEVECLASQVNQVFMNLLVNAAHAINERGTITLRTGHDNDKVWVAVSDTGSGITKENLKNIFDPFFTTKDVGTGTGLGLSLSYGIVQKHGGHIEVDSEVGKGTTFTVYLPVKQPETQAEKSDEATV